MPRLPFAAIAVSLLSASPLAAQAASQPSMVPTPHPVYDWLYEERLAGRIPTYTYEQRPMTRGTIAAHLAKLTEDSASMSFGERQLLRDFLNEFDIRRLVANRALTMENIKGLPFSFFRAVRDRRDPALYAGFSDDSTVTERNPLGAPNTATAAAFSGALWYGRGIGRAQYREGDSTAWAFAYQKAIRMFANTNWGIGWQFEAESYYTSGSRELVLRNPRYGGELVKPGEKTSYQYETFGSYKAKWIEVSMGRGVQSLGPGVTDPLVMRAGAPALGTLRAVIGTPKLNLTYLHSSLFAGTVDDTVIYQGSPIITRTSPERHLVQQRLNYQPFNRLSLTAWSSLVYSNRGVDLDYLNPVLPLLFAQNLMKGDRDNLMIGGDAVLRPWRGTEVYGSILIDDMDPSGPYKGATAIGVQQRLLPGLRAAVGYIAVDPGTYTHWQQLDAYEDHGKFLGPELGPNSEELSARLTAWLPLRTRLMVGMRRQKRGLNPVDSLGQVISCAGGGLEWCDGHTAWVRRDRFAGADVHLVHRFEIQGYSELIRGIPLTFELRNDKVVQGLQLKSNVYMDLQYRYGY